MTKVRLPGHLDLAVCGSDGKLLAQEMTRISGLYSNRKGVMTLPFRFKLAMTPPEGAIIRLQCHAPASRSADIILYKV